MPTPTEATTAIQDKIFNSIQVSQKAVVDSVRSWAETVEALSTNLPQLAFSGEPRPTDVVERTLEFNKRVFASQRDFATKVFEAALPAASAPASATSAATASAKPKV